MAGLQLEPVEAGFGGAPGGGDEVVADAVHVASRHLARRRRDARQVGQGRGRQSGQFPLGEQMVHLLPAALRGAAPPGMADLHADACAGALCTKSTMPLKAMH